MNAELVANLVSAVQCAEGSWALQAGAFGVMGSEFTMRPDRASRMMVEIPLGLVCSVAYLMACGQLDLAGAVFVFDATVAGLSLTSDLIASLSRNEDKTRFVPALTGLVLGLVGGIADTLVPYNPTYFLHSGPSWLRDTFNQASQVEFPTIDSIR